MKVTSAFWRWTLSPRTSFFAWRLSRASRGTISFDVAWREIRLHAAPGGGFLSEGGTPSPTTSAGCLIQAQAPVEPVDRVALFCAEVHRLPPPMLP